MTSIRYAIMYETPESEQIKGEDGYVTNPKSFSPVPQSIAEGDIDNGVSAVFTTTGEQATRWMIVNDPQREEDLKKIKDFPPMSDMLNVPLNVGDYALSAFNVRSNYLSLCRVVGFTGKQVKVLHLSWGSVMSRNADMLIRVHDSVITPEQF